MPLPVQMPVALTTAGATAAAMEAAVATDPTVIPRLPPARTAAKRRGVAGWLGFLAMAALGGALGYFGAKYGMALLLPVPGPKVLKLLVLAWIVPAWLLVVGWHEFGHVVGGWAGGGRFLLWIVGPFKVQRTPAGIRVGLNRSLNLSGGLAACLPLDPEKMTPRRTAVMVLAGPLFSLVLAVAALTLAAWISARPGEVTVGQALVQHGAVVTAGLSGFIFLVTMFPATVGGFKSDGLRAFGLLRGDARSDQEAALLILTTATLGGRRPADYDPALVRRALALGDGSLFDLYAHLTVYAHAADRGDWAAAQGHLDRVLAGEAQLVPYVRDSVRCEYAWLLATRTGDAAAARAWLDSAGALDFSPATRLRAEAAVLLAEGRPAEAAVRARAGLHALEHKSLSPVKSPFEEEALAGLLRRAEPAGA
jgi:hypothetical protein